ncbi:fasciclin domain-containing protein [Sphingorhabdus sp. SMR4y]|uniref:fasciclin domain-containing protein n=1 Tax=Sphingorhabdus sp. SMR4y TaxID=2584094 RepID=UPI000B5CE148|nr:fasciclin domain-containing protein [Sphingorhabdus sp. SMR4y]ASK89790.1 fasciclin domain protein [Sphingorhabdus sp. SMR4y]
MFNAPKIILASTLLALVPACSSELSEEEQAILDTRLADEQKPTNLIAVLQANPELSTASTLLGLSGVGAELDSDGSYTAFAATNEVYNTMDSEKLSALMQSDNKDELVSITKYSLVDGKMTSADIAKAIADGDGTASITTLQGDAIKATMDGDKIILEDGAGNMINVTQADIESTNGALHIIDGALMPK